MSAYGQSAAPPGQDADGALRERIVKLEERLETQRQTMDRMQTDLTKVKDQNDDLTTFKNNAVYYFSGAMTVIVALFGGLAWFFYGRLQDRIEKDGGTKVIVDAVLDALYADDTAKFTRIFEQHRNELVRVIMAREQSIAFVGEHKERELIKKILKRMGYKTFVKDTAKAKLAVVFCEQATFPELAKQLEDDIRAHHLPRRLVLYSAGGKHLDPTLVSNLNTWATVIPANMPATVASQVATLAALAQPVREEGRG